MSYHIVKSIKIEDGKVFITGADNNVIPRTPHKWECYPLSKILQENGRESLDLEILKSYEERNFQAGRQNKYTRALKVLRHLPEYPKFDWRTIEDREEARRSKEFEELLLKALKTPLPKQKYIITKRASDGIAYFYQRKGAGFCKWYSDRDKAKRFDFKEDAEFIKKCFTNSEGWEIVPAH